MRAGIFLAVLALVEACTNDYGEFRIPKSQAAAQSIDAGGATDGGATPADAVAPEAG
jgi:hypothetical protein